MAFSDFKTIDQVIRQYPLQIRREQFLPDVSVPLPPLVLENFNFSLQNQGEQESEVFFRESFIYPLLQEVWKRHARLKLWVNQKLEYDDVLQGEPDYFVAKQATHEVISRVVNKPLLAVAEAKRQDFTEGWGQCLAEMIACQKVNADEDVTVYGIVTTGVLWEFGRLAQQVFTRDPRSFALTDPQRVLGLLDFVFAECEKQI